MFFCYSSSNKKAIREWVEVVERKRKKMAAPFPCELPVSVKEKQKTTKKRNLI